VTGGVSVFVPAEGAGNDGVTVQRGTMRPMVHVSIGPRMGRGTACGCPWPRPAS
jgi:hypothetical protein